MKKIIYHTAILLGIIALNSCSSDQVSDPNSIETYIFKSNLSSVENQVFVQVTGVNNAVSVLNNVQVDFMEGFQPFKIDGSNFNSGLFVENNLSIGNGENMNMTNVTSLGNLKEISYQGINEEVYVPNLVEVPQSLFTNNLFVDISKANGLTIPCVQDSDNPFSKIFLAIMNRGERFVDDNAQGVISEILNDENQSFFISPEALSDFEIGNEVDVYLARGNEVQINETAFVFYNINSMFGRIVD